MSRYSQPLTWAEGTSPTTEQFLPWFDSLTPDERLKVMDDVRVTGQQGMLCIQMDHEGSILYLSNRYAVLSEKWDRLKDHVEHLVEKVNHV